MTSEIRTRLLDAVPIDYAIHESTLDAMTEPVAQMLHSERAAVAKAVRDAAVPIAHRRVAQVWMDVADFIESLPEATHGQS